MCAKKSLDRAPVSPQGVGLCADCRHRRLQRAEHSLFIRCALARTDPAFARYPRLPVISCDGYATERD